MDIGMPTFHGWLSANPERDRLRSIQKSQRIVRGTSRWPLGWLKVEGAICYERAAGRISQERGGKPDSSFLKGVVKTRELPTAIASHSDHYVILQPGGGARFMSVEEVARSFGIVDGSPMMEMLKVPRGVLSKNQAVACLGRSVSVHVARRIVALLVSRGLIARGLRYGSAYSGIDTFAVAVDEATGGEWEYSFASEANETTRGGLLRAWGQRGLRDEMCFRSAQSPEATAAPYVDLMVITANCEDYSPRNHSRDAAKQRSSLEDVWECLSYVRAQRPRVLVVENSTDARVVAPLTGLLSRLEWYTLEAGELDPREVAGAPVARERHFWVLVGGHI